MRLGARYISQLSHVRIGHHVALWYLKQMFSAILLFLRVQSPPDECKSINNSFVLMLTPLYVSPCAVTFAVAYDPVFVVTKRARQSCPQSRLITYWILYHFKQGNCNDWQPRSAYESAAYGQEGYCAALLCGWYFINFSNPFLCLFHPMREGGAPLCIFIYVCFQPSNAT